MPVTHHRVFLKDVTYKSFCVHADKKGILDMSLRTAENMLKVSGEELKNQLCQNTPLTVLATVLTSSLELDKVSLFVELFHVFNYAKFSTAPCLQHSRLFVIFCIMIRLYYILALYERTVLGYCLYISSSLLLLFLYC